MHMESDRSGILMIEIGDKFASIKIGECAAFVGTIVAFVSAGRATFVVRDVEGRDWVRTKRDAARSKNRTSVTGAAFSCTRDS